jgi:hypothetical protein
VQISHLNYTRKQDFAAEMSKNFPVSYARISFCAMAQPSGWEASNPTFEELLFISAKSVERSVFSV